MSDDRLDMQDCVSSQIKAFGLGSRYDANETATFARELEWIQAGAIEKKFPNLIGANLVPLAGGAIFPGARSHTYREIDSWGEAEILEEYTIDDFGTAEVRGQEVKGSFRNFGAKYIYTLEDLRARPSLTVDVIQNKAVTARRVMEEKLDKLILLGDGPFTGLLANGNSQDDTSSDDWETGTVSGDVTAMRNTFKRMVDNAFIATKGVYTQFDFIVSNKMWTKLNLWLDATISGGETVKSFLLTKLDGVRSITPCARFDGAGATGKDRMICFPRDPEVIDALVPERFTQLAPQLNGAAFVTPCVGKYGGLRIFQPLAIRRCDVTMT